VKKLGCRWAFISRAMKGTRTENMIKNRTFALIKKHCPNKAKKLKDSQIDAVIAVLEVNVAEVKMKHMGDMDGIPIMNLQSEKNNASQKSQLHASDLLLDLPDIFSRERHYIFGLESDDNWEYN
jgi:hypothetical protein